MRKNQKLWRNVRSQKKWRTPLVLEKVREGETKNKTCYLVDISLDVKETEKGVQITPPGTDSSRQEEEVQEVQK